MRARHVLKWIYKCVHRHVSAHVPQAREGALKEESAELRSKLGDRDMALAELRKGTATSEGGLQVDTPASHPVQTRVMGHI